MLKKVLIAVALVLLAGIAFFWWYTRPLPILTVTSWSGEYSSAQQRAMMRPYASANRVDVRLALWEGDLAGLESTVRAHAYKGDVIDFELPKAVEACHRGLLEKMDAGALPTGDDGTAAANDFVPSAIGPCWVGSVIYSQVIVFAPQAGAQPTTLADFFDTAKFPGRRALSRQTPKFTLEMALLADGIAPRDIYPMLATPDGLARAFNKLKALNPIWAQGSTDAINWVKSGQARFAEALNGDVFDAARHGFAPGVIWDHQVYEMDVFGIPAGDPNKDRALDFIRFATGTAPLANMAEWVPYGPARRSAWTRVGDNPELKIPMQPHLPTTPPRFANAFGVDEAWWRAHEAAILPRWQAFVLQTEGP